MPTIVFYVIHLLVGILPAMITSLLFSLSNAICSYIKEKRISSTQLFGLIGLGLSTIGVIFTDNEKLYYVPALASNFLFLCFAVGLTIKRKSILHYVTRDFNIESLNKVSEIDLLLVNVIWLIFFVLKVLSKSLGILFLSFNELYWLVFVLGDPMTLIVVAYSIYYINKVVRKEYSANNDEQS
jgi:intracellular septation protein A